MTQWLNNITWYWSKDSDILRLGRWLQAWWKVMAAYCRGMTWNVTCGLTACTPGSAPGPTVGNEYAFFEITSTLASALPTCNCPDILRLHLETPHYFSRNISNSSFICFISVLIFPLFSSVNNSMHKGLVDFNLRQDWKWHQKNSTSFWSVSHAIW